MVAAGEILPARPEPKACRCSPSILSTMPFTSACAEEPSPKFAASGSQLPAVRFERCRSTSSSKSRWNRHLEHPTWVMGQRITIDSATMLNKGLEIIEACRLFDLPPSSVKVAVHPQSTVHSLVEYVDGSILAQISVTDMRLPILYALSFPERIESELTFDMAQLGHLDSSNRTSSVSHVFDWPMKQPKLAELTALP